MPPDEAAAIVAGAGASERDPNRLAVANYARAMDHVGVMAVDPSFSWSDRVILDLHFDACHFQREHAPGSWRTRPVAVTSSDGGIAYQAPPWEDVPALMAEVVGWLGRGEVDDHVIVRAAMAHLHVVSVHPFRDGNGRVARIVQSLVLTREGLLAPEFNSIEEYLGGKTADYYAVLGQVQGGRYQPKRDARPWVEFCIAAHVEQARKRLDQVTRAAERWEQLDALAKRRGWPDRLVVAMELSLFGGIERAAYAREAEISLPTATADIRRLVDADLVTRSGRTRNARYLASEALRGHVGR